MTFLKTQSMPLFGRCVVINNSPNLFSFIVKISPGRSTIDKQEFSCRRGARGDDTPCDFLLVVALTYSGGVLQARVKEPENRSSNRDSMVCT